MLSSGARSALGALVLAVALLPSVSAGQSPQTPQTPQTPWRFAAGGGILAWDARASGKSPTLVARADRATSKRWLGWEVGGVYSTMDEPPGEATETLALDAQLQLLGYWHRVQPYAGIGASFFVYMKPSSSSRGRTSTGHTVSVGARTELTRHIGLVTDFRYRGWGFDTARTFTINKSGEATIALTLRR